MGTPSRRRRYDTSLTASLGAVRREVAAALGMAAILFNLIAGIALSSGARANATMLDDLLGDRIVICTAGGMLVLDRDGTPLRREMTPDQLCVFCLPLVSGTGLAATAPAPALPPPVATLHIGDVPLAVVSVPPLVRATSPRGPPAAVATV